MHQERFKRTNRLTRSTVKTMKKTKQIQVKFFKEESIFNLIDLESLELYRQMMADRYGSLNDEEE